MVQNGLALSQCYDLSTREDLPPLQLCGIQLPCEDRWTHPAPSLPPNQPSTRRDLMLLSTQAGPSILHITLPQ